MHNNTVLKVFQNLSAVLGITSFEPNSQKLQDVCSQIFLVIRSKLRPYVLNQGAIAVQSSANPPVPTPRCIFWSPPYIPPRSGLLRILTLGFHFGSRSRGGGKERQLLKKTLATQLNGSSKQLASTSIQHSETTLAKYRAPNWRKTSPKHPRFAPSDPCFRHFIEREMRNLAAAQTLKPANTSYTLPEAKNITCLCRRSHIRDGGGRKLK